MQTLLNSLKKSGQLWPAWPLSLCKNNFLFIPQEKKEKAHNKELEQKIKGLEAAHAASQELSWVS